MIFVTVGTNYFESLIASVDKVAPNINEKIICCSKAYKLA